EAKVVFETTTGQRAEIWVPVSIHVERGPTRVRYLPGDPDVARLAADPTPRSTDLPALLIFIGFCGLVALALMAGFRAIDRSLGLRDG
ncbi:MAG: hypothetical protein QOG82_1362, partial [Actinomycetota bacterium]|nr:hypothetical protein [Actinomycetota bacterium]